MSQAITKETLPWHTSLWAEWLRQLDAVRMPHALLLSGLVGLGKRQLAEAFSQALLCAADSEHKPCGDCKSCRLIQAGSHPDLRILEPEEVGKGIKISQIRDLVVFLAGTAQQGGWKCVVIEPADAMNHHAANALLKSLEEPPAATMMILVTATPSRLTATLRSRCHQLRLKAPPREEALTWLKPQLGDRAEALLDYALGAPLAALAASQQGKLDTRAEILALLLDLAQGQGTAIDAAKRIQGFVGLEAMDQLLVFLGDAAKAQVGSAAPPDVASAPWCAVLERVDRQLLFRFRDKLIRAKDLLLGSANPNKQLLWEELMLDWQALGKTPRTRSVA
ncbi:MAG: DNA polymerase III subunit delta' [Cellvibrionaceae bacterium]